MAIQPKCGRDAPAPRLEPAGLSGFPSPSVFPPFQTPEARLQRQLDALAAIRDQLRALESEWPGAPGSSAVVGFPCGEFLLHRDLCRFRHELGALSGACAALARENQTRLDRVRPALERLRDLRRAGRGEMRHER